MGNNEIRNWSLDKASKVFCFVALFQYFRWTSFCSRLSRWMSDIRSLFVCRLMVMSAGKGPSTQLCRFSHRALVAEREKIAFFGAFSRGSWMSNRSANSLSLVDCAKKTSVRVNYNYNSRTDRCTIFSLVKNFFAGFYISSQVGVHVDVIVISQFWF